MSFAPMRFVFIIFAAVLGTHAVPAVEDAAQQAAAYVQFVEEPSATCVSRNGVQILVKNAHPTRPMRIWLDRIQMGVGTGDRSRTDLPPASEPDPLGCSRSTAGTQEWRLVKAVFID